ncbi:MAG: transporter substrate-binding domain-containing protein [Actinomycetota bacterium]
MRIRRKRAAAPLILAIAASLVLGACGGGGGGGGLTIKEGTLTVASDIPYPPFEFNEGQKLTGFDVEVIDEIAKRLDLETNWVNTDFTTIFTKLSTGDFDVIAAAVTAYAPKGSPAYTKVTDRRKIVAFSKPYYPSLQSLAVNTDNRADITGVDSLKSGDRIAIQSGTTGAFYAEEKLKPIGVDLVSFGKSPDMYVALDAGQVDGVFNDLPVSEDAEKAHPNLKIVEQVDTGEQYGFAVNQDNTELLDKLNAGLQDMFDDGTYASIYKKYFPTQELPPYAKS